MRNVIVCVLVCLTLVFAGFVYARQSSGQTQQAPFPIIIERVALLNLSPSLGTPQQPVPLFTIPRNGLYRVSATVTGTGDLQECFNVGLPGFPNGLGAVAGCLNQFTNFGGSTAIVPLNSGDSIGYFTSNNGSTSTPLNAYVVIRELGAPQSGMNQQ